MAKKAQRGRPKAKQPLAKMMHIRLQTEEHDDFSEAAELAGLDLSSWVRERLRTIAREELKEYGKEPSFLTRKKKPAG